MGDSPERIPVSLMILDGLLFRLLLNAVNLHIVFHNNIIAVNFPNQITRLVAAMIAYEHHSFLNRIDPPRISMYAELPIGPYPWSILRLAVYHCAFAAPRTGLARLCLHLFTEGRCSDSTDRQNQQNQKYHNCQQFLSVFHSE